MLSSGVSVARVEGVVPWDLLAGSVRETDGERVPVGLARLLGEPEADLEEEEETEGVRVSVRLAEGVWGEEGEPPPPPRREGV